MSSEMTYGEPVWRKSNMAAKMAGNLEFDVAMFSMCCNMSTDGFSGALNPKMWLKVTFVEPIWRKSNMAAKMAAN